MQTAGQYISVYLMKDEDAEAVLEIYDESIRSDDATCVTQVPSWQEWCGEHDLGMRYVAKMADRVVGFVAVSQVFCSPFYQGVGEISVYVRKQYRHAGVGTSLLTRLIQEIDNRESLQTNGFYMLQSRIFTNNESSIALHKKMGFRLVGKRERILKKDGVWRDVYVYERRSRIYEEGPE